MDPVYYNDDMPSTTTSDRRCTQYRGNSIQKQEVTSPKWTKVLLIILSISLVFALGGLCVLGIMSVCSVSADDEKLLHKYNAAKNCLSLCTAHRGKCYFFSSKKQTWFESRDLCVASKARLVSINNKEIQDFLVSKIKETHWIGLNDLETEGHWVWMNSQTLSETGVQFWHMRVSWPSEPDNWKEDDPSGENCASLGYWEGFLNEWFDNSCKMQKTVAALKGIIGI
uniref:C-type lectin domain-containing protein n=1 Tax=Sinocyclocheilus rhinocerous TaxID=307959 RepID=A0A673LI55_9TELE